MNAVAVENLNLGTGKPFAQPAQLALRGRVIDAQFENARLFRLLRRRNDLGRKIRSSQQHALGVVVWRLRAMFHLLQCGLVLGVISKPRVGRLHFFETGEP